MESETSTNSDLTLMIPIKVADLVQTWSILERGRLYYDLCENKGIFWAVEDILVYNEGN